MRTLKDELMASFGLAQPVEQAFCAIAGQGEIEIFTTGSVHLQEPLANGSWEIDELSFIHAIASMYGRITFVTRQILA